MSFGEFMRNKVLAGLSTPAQVSQPSNTVVDAVFSTTIPLSSGGQTYMAAKTVTGPLVFTASTTKVKNSQTFLRLTADGINAPTFSGMLQKTGASSYDNRNGIVNIVEFFYDGVDVSYLIRQYVGAVPIDNQAPTLSSPSGTQTGQTTANGSVTTDEANGTLYYMVSLNATESAATVKAGATKAVTATGVQSVSFTGLTANTKYYTHWLHKDAAGNESAVVNGSGFTTAAVATMASTYISSSTNGAFASYAGATMSGSSPNMQASTEVRINLRSALTTSASVPAVGDFKLVWGKAAANPSQSVCPIVFSNIGVPANSPNGNTTTSGTNAVGTPTKLGGWSSGSDGTFGTFSTTGTMYAYGSPGNYVLWIVYSDGSSKMFDNNTGSPVIWVLS